MFKSSGGYGSWFRILSPLKVFNILKVFSGYLFSVLMKSPKVWGKPLYMSVEPSAGCNLSCPECPAGNGKLGRPTGNMDEKLFRKMVDENRRTLLWMNLYHQGEPFLHPSLADMVRYANSAGIFTSVSTNGHFLSSERAKETVDSGLKRLIVSVDGVDQPTYSAYRRGGDLERVLDGIGKVVYWKNQLHSYYPEIVIQFLVTRKNEHQISGIKELTKRLGADKLQIKTAQLYPGDQLSEWIPSQESLSRYTGGPGGYVLKNKLRNRCLRLWTTAVVTWQGDLVPCCFDKDAQYRMGNLGEKSLKSSWKGPVFKGFRQKVLKNRKSVEICSNCCEGMKVLF